MEKGSSIAMKRKTFKIVITGPESTGKSTLAEQLANHYHSDFIPEYARMYIQNLNRPYVYEDLENIAKRQVQDLKKYESLADKLLILDTYLIITKVWFDVVYQKYPPWIVEALKNSHIDLYLLCATDLPWEPDSVRENGGEQRERLFLMYKKELEQFGFNHRIVNGFGEKRLGKAISFIEEFLDKNLD